MLGWFPLTKGVSNLWRYAEVSLQANRRYLEALAVVDDPGGSQRLLDRVCAPVADGSRERRGLNPLRRCDQELFAAVLRGEHALQGFRNRDLRQRLVQQPPRGAAARRRLSARVTRLSGLLRAHGLIAKVPRARRYRVTARGHAFLSAALYLRHKAFPRETKEVA